MYLTSFPLPHMEACPRLVSMGSMLEEGVTRQKADDGVGATPEESRHGKQGWEKEKVSCHAFAMEGSADPRKSSEAGVVLLNCLKLWQEDRAFLSPYQSVI